MCIFILMDRYLEKVKKEVEKQLDNDVFFVNNEEEIANNLNKILLKTISIQKEEISSNSQYYVQVGDNFISKRKPIFFSIFIAVISSFYKEKYLEGIKKLSIVAGFLQNNSSFQKVKNHDMIQNGLEDFVVTSEVFSKEKFGEVSQYPFLIYKIGLIPVLQNDLIPEIVPSVKNL